ncbi:MAG: hypothetical protein HY821_24620 [Acidobacteria bacterium]|nr:hypothetical protein [Acidobacteriota bacterium]
MILRRSQLAAALFFLAAAVRLTLIFGMGKAEVGRPEPVKIAITLARTGSFADPYALPTGKTAHSPPIYPAIIALPYAIWGDSLDADRARFVLSALAGSAEYALLPFVSAALGMGLLPGVVAGAAGALIPLHHWQECQGEFEVAWVAIFLEVSVILFCRWLARRKLTSGSAVRSGAWWGAGLLLAPNLAPVLAGFAVVAGGRLRPGKGHAIRWIALFTAAATLVLLPWSLRNYALFGNAFFVRNNLGLELYVSNHDDAVPEMNLNTATPFFQSRHPHASQEAARVVQRVGETAFERQRLRLALDWIRNNPVRFTQLTLLRFRNFWFPGALPRPNMAALWLLTLAAAGGFVGLCRQNGFAAAVLAAILGPFPVIYYCVQNDLRYQHPIYWALLLLASSLALRLTGMDVQDAQKLGSQLDSDPQGDSQHGQGVGHASRIERVE